MRDSREFQSASQPSNQLPIPKPTNILCSCVTSHHHKFPQAYMCGVHVLVSVNVSQEIEWKGKGDPTIRKATAAQFFLYFSFSYFVLLWLGMSIELDGIEGNFSLYSHWKIRPLLNAFLCSFLRKCFVQLARWMAVGWMNESMKIMCAFHSVECPVL